jgi:hypothetical protein
MLVSGCLFVVVGVVVGGVVVGGVVVGGVVVGGVIVGGVVVGGVVFVVDVMISVRGIQGRGEYRSDEEDDLSWKRIANGGISHGYKWQLVNQRESSQKSRAGLDAFTSGLNTLRDWLSKYEVKRLRQRHHRKMRRKNPCRALYGRTITALQNRC